MILQFNGLRRDKTLQIILILDNNLFWIEVEISGVTVQVPLDVKGRRKKFIFVFFDGFEMALPYLGKV